MAALFFGWNKIKEFKVEQVSPEIAFSIIIPFRNEAENLPFLLNSLIQLKYPPDLFEILLVNDASEDDSLKICTDFLKVHPKINMKLIQKEGSSTAPKKDAITTAVKNAKFKYIVTTDADCIFPNLWLQVFNQKILETRADLLAGPVQIQHIQVKAENKALKLFHGFQEMDFMSLQAAGAGGFGIKKAFMCNGANLCYLKSAFFTVNGFQGNEAISSGDDVFLLQKFRRENFKTDFIKCTDAIVLTKPQPGLKELISQRKRWAAKTPAYSSNFAKFTGLSVLLMNFSLVAGFFLSMFLVIPFEPVLMAFLFKFLVDLALIYKAATFFRRKDILRHYFWSSLVYPFFSTWVAFASLSGNYTWKGRIAKR